MNKRGTYDTINTKPFIYTTAEPNILRQRYDGIKVFNVLGYFLVVRNNHLSGFIVSISY